MHETRSVTAAGLSALKLQSRRDARGGIFHFLRKLVLYGISYSPKRISSVHSAAVHTRCPLTRSDASMFLHK